MSDYIINFTDPANGSFVIKPYTSNGPETPISALPLDSNAATADTSIVLLGKGLWQYGERIQESIVHMLEHFSYATAPVHPIQGQMWYKNVAPKGLFLYDGVSWINIAVSGLITSDLDMNSFKIINLADPTAAQDAVTLAFANTTYVNITGDTMTGALAFGGGPSISAAGLNMNVNPITNVSAPSAGGDATNKTYVDGLIVGLAAEYIALDGANTPTTGLIDFGAGFTVSGGNVTVDLGSLISFGGNKIADVANPTLAQDVATKDYVDTIIGSGDSLVSGALDPLTGVLTLTSLVSGDVLVTNIAAFNHTHESSDIFHNTNPSYTESAIREIIFPIDGTPSTTFANDSLTSVVNIIDQELYSLRARNARTIIDAVEYPVVGFTIGASGDFQIAGDFTDLFLPGYQFEVINDTNGPTNQKYTVASSSFGAGDTTIVVTGTVPATAVGDGDVVILTYDVNFVYPVEKNKLMLFQNGIKLYAAERGYADTEFLVGGTTPVDLGDWCGLLNGTFSFDLAVDGGGADTIAITVAQTTYTVNGVVTGINGSWQISGNHAATFNAIKNKTIVVDDTLFGVPLTYTILEAVDSGANTLVYVNETIGAANGAGSLFVAFTMRDLAAEINDQIQTGSGNDDAYCAFEDGLLLILSDTVGTGSQITVTDIDLTAEIETNFGVGAGTFDFINAPAVTRPLGYSETGRAFTFSSLITLESPIPTSGIVEISLAR